jgi:putative DNA primase/helicase
MLSLSLTEVIQRAGGFRPDGRGIRIRCAGHRGKKFNCAVWEENGEANFKCYSKNCSPLEIRIALLGQAPSKIDFAPQPALSDAQRRQKAQRLWREAYSISGTLGEVYLNSRAITELSKALRFHPRLRHPTGLYLPAIVGAVTHERGGREIVAVHRIFLSPDGLGKAKVEPTKMSLGKVAGGSIRLAPAAEKIALAEGVETALSVQQATGLPTFVMLGSSNRPTLPKIVKEVILCSDADRAGSDCVRVFATSYVSEGFVVRIARPLRYRTDFNDVLRESSWQQERRS